MTSTESRTEERLWPPTAPIGIETVAIGRRAVITVDGELDMLTTPGLAHAVDAAFDAGAHEVWIDLAPTGFADSSVVHCLVDAHQRARSFRRRLAVICPDGPVRRTLVLSGADGVLPLFATRHEAHRGS